MATEIKEFERAKVFNFNEIIDYADGSVVSKTIVKKETGTVTLFSFDKGQGLSEHTAPFDAMVQVIDGEAEIFVDGKPHVLKAGDSIIMPAKISHALKATERFKMILTMIKSN